MKDISKKIIAIIVIMLMMVNSSLLTLVSMALDVIENNIDATKVEVQGKIDIDKYVNYSVGDDRGLLLKLDIKTGIEYKEEQENKKLESTIIVAETPKIEDEYPNKVEVIGISTKEFEYAYNEEKGKFAIQIMNNGRQIYSNEFKVNLYYGENCYSDEIKHTEIPINAMIKEKIVDDNEIETEIEKNIEQVYNVEENISGLISEDIATSEIFKGYIKSNSKNGTDYETIFNETRKINIDYKDISDEIYILNNTRFGVKDNADIDTNEIIYKNTKLNKNEILDILGQDGKLEILDNEGNVLLNIDKDTETLDDGTIEINYEHDITDISIRTSKPVNLGIITINNTKAIKSTMVDINVSGIKTDKQIICKNEEEIYQYKDESIVEFKESETKIDINIDNTNWMTYINNNVEFNLTLLANDSRYDLFENPVIDITLPEQVEKVVLGEASVLYDDNLSIKNIMVIEEDGSKVIRIELDGTQSGYFLNSIIQGANIVLPTTIIMKKDALNAQANITVKYNNQNSIATDYSNMGNDSKEYAINIISNSNIEQDKGEQDAIATSSEENSEIYVDIKATVGTKQLQENDEVFEEQIIKYTVKLKNITDKKIDNVNVIGNIPEGTLFATVFYGADYGIECEYHDGYKYITDDTKTEYEETISLEAGEERELFYEVKINKLADGEKQKNIRSNIKVNIENSNRAEYAVTNIVKPAEMTIDLKAWEVDEDSNLILYDLYMINNLDADIKNVNVEIELPKELKYAYVSDFFTDKIIEENNKLTITIDNFEAKSEKDLIFYANVEGTSDNVTEYVVKTVAVAKGEDTSVYNSNENRRVVYTDAIEVVQTSAKEGENVSYDEEIEYNFVIKNTSNAKYKKKKLNISVLDFIDKNLEPVRAEYEYFEEDEVGNLQKKTAVDDFSLIDGELEDYKDGKIPDLKIETSIPTGEYINVKVIVKADMVFERTEISNKIDVIWGDKTKSSNIITNVILPVENSGEIDPGDEPGNDEKKDSYNISGTAWVDKNKDGQMNVNEEKISNMTVKLFNSDNGTIVKDKDNKNMTVVTDKDGKYEFKDIPKGNYLVIFEYDDVNYTVTTYKQTGVNENLNSDVIVKEVSIDGNVSKVAVSDILKLESANIEHINIGLAEKAKFDLSLNKTITKVSVVYNGKASEKEYNATKLAKVEIPAKQISNTTLIIEYQIEIKNEGNIDGYVDEIIDYMPRGLEFDSEMNKDWFKTTDGNLKNVNLTGKKMAVGESQISKIYLTKDMTETGTGTIKNSAEILKSSNLSGITDIDSVAGNKNVNEDDYSEAELIVSIKTGVVTYTLLIIGIIAILIALKILIDKKIINIKGIKMFAFVAIIVGITLCINYSNATVKTDLEEKLKEKYKGVVYNLKFGVGYEHFWDTPHGYDVLYCSDNMAMCGHEDHYYKYAGIKNFDATPLKTEVTEEMASLSYVKRKGEIKELNSEYSIAGPFILQFSGKLEISDVKTEFGSIDKEDFKIVDSRGRTKTINSNEEFYIMIPSTSAKSLTAKATVSKTVSTRTSYSISYTEIWKCIGSCKNGIPQVMNRKRKEETIKETNKTSKLKSTLIAGKITTPPPPPDHDHDEETAELQIVKVDDGGEETPLKGVGFTISTQIKIWEFDHTVNATKPCTHWHDGYSVPDGHGGYIPIPGYYEHPSGDNWTKNIYKQNEYTKYLGEDLQWGDTPSTFYTDDEGMISLSGIKLPEATHATNVESDGDNKDLEAEYVNNTAIATEVENPYYGYSTKDDEGKNITFEIDRTKENTLENPQKYVKLSGYVWIDGHDGKATLRNDLFDTGEESGFDGIPVYLKDRSGNTIKTTTTSELGLYSEINGGEYQFTEVDLDELEKENYHIEFEYNGLIYKSVTPSISETNGSKAEDTYTRDSLDNKFWTVDGNGSQTLKIKDATVNYSNTKNYISTMTGSSGTNVIASTDEADYNIYDDFEPTMEEIRYINFGVYEKQQADYAVTKDLYNVRAEINGFNHIYKYASTRYKDDKSTIDEDSSWNIGVKFEKNTGSYSRAIYTSDYAYTNEEDKSKELKVYVTYKIAMKNESTYVGKINSLVDYFDKRAKIIDIGDSIDDKDNIGGIDFYYTESAYNDKYSSYTINVDTQLNSGETKFIYVQFKLDREKILEIITPGSTEGTLLNNVVEINSYTTFKDESMTTSLAVVDKDSVPGNAIPGSLATYEDDTDAARSLKLELRNAREIKGIVFEDKDTKGKGTEVKENEERIGNGIYDTGEKSIKEVVVQLWDLDKNEMAKIYDSETKTVSKDATYTTNDDGTFSFSGYIPGNYEVRYTWGNEKYKVQYYKGTIYREDRKQSDPYWYRGLEYGNDTINAKVESVPFDRYSDALDNNGIRESIDEEMYNIQYNILENEINKAYSSEGSESIKQTKMMAATPKMSFSVEYEITATDGEVEQYKFTVPNIDYGIVERPKQQLEFSKRVSAFKITLANGQVLVDAKVTEDGSVTGSKDYTTYIGPTDVTDGFVRVEMDNELIEGATLETTYTMKVKNVGEKDYRTKRYYYYGNTKKYDGTDAELVKVSVTELLDYVDARLTVLDSKWNEKDEDYLTTVNASEKGNTTYLNSTRQYMTTELSKQLAPGEVNTVDLFTSKLLTSTDDNTFNNKSEITKVTKERDPKDPGDKDNTGTPVKVTWNEDKTFNFNEDNSETVIIIPSTGEDRGYVLPIIIGMSSLLIVGLGAFGIKKFVIDI